MSTELDAIALAACIHRAKHLFKSRPEEEGEDLYWTVREACADLARDRSVKWFDVLLFEKGMWLEEEDKCLALSSQFWDLVVPPQIVVEETMSS